MSGNISNGGSTLFFPRNPRNATIAIVRSNEMRRKPRIISVLVDDGDVLSAGALQKFASLDLGKPRIASLDSEEEAVVSHAAETRPVEHWMVPPRQTIHDLPGKKCGERGKQHRQFEHDREERRHRPPGVRFAVHDQ